MLFRKIFAINAFIEAPWHDEDLLLHFFSLPKGSPKGCAPLILPQV